MTETSHHVCSLLLMRFCSTLVEFGCNLPTIKCNHYYPSLQIYYPQRSLISVSIRNQNNHLLSLGGVLDRGGDDLDRPTGAWGQQRQTHPCRGTGGRWGEGNSGASCSQPNNKIAWGLKNSWPQIVYNLDNFKWTKPALMLVAVLEV